jgi:2-methylcitrate dehydratase PrpD
MTTLPPATSRIASYVVEAAPGSLPDDVRREALRSFFNILGCTVGGSRHPAVEITEKAVLPFAGAAQATLIGRGKRSDLLTACLINTLSSSVNTYDDTHAEAIVHPGGPVMATVLAIAERQRVSGRDLLHAFALGVEMECRLSMAVSVAPAKAKIAWSQTGITSGIGAAIAAGKLLGLETSTLQTAIGIAASQAAGIRAMHGTICTAMMPAHGGQVGLRAAFLAEAGVTSKETSIEAKYGFAECFAEAPHLSHLVDGLGERFEIRRNTYKPYPCGIVIHPLIDACLQLKAEHTFDSREIEQVRIKANPTALALCDRRHPKDEFEGQVSLHHWVAAALTRGKADVPEGTDASIQVPDIAALRDRVAPVADPAIPPDGTDVTLVLRDGRTFEIRVRNCIGSKDRPMTDRELERKFEGLAEEILSRERTRALMDTCWRLEALADASDLIRATSPA